MLRVWNWLNSKTAYNDSAGLEVALDSVLSNNNVPHIAITSKSPEHIALH